MAASILGRTGILAATWPRHGLKAVSNRQVQRNFMKWAEHPKDSRAREKWMKSTEHYVIYFVVFLTFPLTAYYNYVVAHQARWAQIT